MDSYYCPLCLTHFIYKRVYVFSLIQVLEVERSGFRLLDNSLRLPCRLYIVVYCVHIASFCVIIIYLFHTLDICSCSFCLLFSCEMILGRFHLLNNMEVVVVQQVIYWLIRREAMVHTPDSTFPTKRNISTVTYSQKISFKNSGNK